MAEAGENASHTFPVQAGALKKGHHVCIKGFPCKIVEITTSKTGKHGHAKANITAIDIFTAKKYQDICPTSHNMDAPNVTKVNLQYCYMDGEDIVALDEDGTEQRFSKPIDQEVMAAIVAADESGDDIQVVVTSAMGKDIITEIKADKNN